MADYDENSDSQTFWNEEGGRKWVENIDVVEAFILPLSDALVDEIDARPGEKVLDVGCGGGVTSRRLADAVGTGGSVLGVDVSAPILSVANRRAAAANLEFRLGDAASLDLGENTFDVITSRFGVMFFDDPVKAFSNLHSSLKPSGRLVFLCWRTLDENPWMSETGKAAFAIVPPPADAPPPDPTAPGPFSLGEKAHLSGILEAAGYSGITVTAQDMPLNMGQVDETVDFLMKMGPAAEAARDAAPDQLDAIRAAVRKVVGRFETSEGIIVPTASWIVRAQK